MHPFSYVEASTPQAAAAAFGPDAMFFAGGTTLMDLMKLDVLSPAVLVDVNRLPFSSITTDNDSVTIGAGVRNSDVAHHPTIRESFPVLSEALLSGASAQLRNMASTGGNLLQRTRCFYFRDINSKCNKRQPGSGCDAMSGINRGNAILGTSDSCIATNPSDMCVALAALEAVIQTQKQNGESRSIPIAEFYLLPGDTPHRETVLEKGELIVAVEIPKTLIGRHSHYLKVRDRASYEFALASAAVALEMDGQTISKARVAFGGIGTIPWRSKEAEAVLQGNRADAAVFRQAGEAALAGAIPHEHNRFKIELAKRTLVAALEELTQ